ncbi:hypothetical protein ACFW5S_15285 [Streptomyces olivaceus]
MNHKRVGQVMRTWGMGGPLLHKRQVTTAPAPILFRHDFTATVPNTK